MSTPINQLLPQRSENLSDTDILDAYAFPQGQQWLRMNFVTSLDGAATRNGKSGLLGDAADRRVFQLLRWEADVVIVGAGTARAEEYDAMRLDEAAPEWREERDLAAHPTLVLVSRSLELDPESPMFTQAPERPIIYTVSSAPENRRDALSRVADVVVAGEKDAEPLKIRNDLVERGFTRLHAEGGPHLLGSFIDAAAVDELCLTIAPSLEAGDARRISASPTNTPTDMCLVSLLQSGSELLARYHRR